MSNKLRIKKKSKKFKAADLPVELKHVNLNAAGIDIGSDRHMVAVPAGRDEVTVREFGAFTTDLHALADWLEKCGVTTIAMESTGVYWIPLFEILEQCGFEVKLVDARKSKNVSAPKSDVLDCQWAANIAHLRSVDGSVSSRRRDLRAARLHASKRDACSIIVNAYSTYAESAAADEPAAA